MRRVDSALRRVCSAMRRVCVFGALRRVSSALRRVDSASCCVCECRMVCNEAFPDGGVAAAAALLAARPRVEQSAAFQRRLAVVARISANTFSRECGGRKW